MINKKIIYNFKSLPGQCMIVPEENAKKAEDLVKAIINAETSGELFFNAIYTELRSEDSPYASDKYLLPRAMDLMFAEKGSAESLRLQDNVYVRTCNCLYGQGKGIKNEDEKVGAIKVAECFISLLENRK